MPNEYQDRLFDALNSGYTVRDPICIETVKFGELIEIKQEPLTLPAGTAVYVQSIITADTGLFAEALYSQNEGDEPEVAFVPLELLVESSDHEFSDYPCDCSDHH